MSNTTTKRKHSSPAKQSPKLSTQPPVQVLDPNAAAKGIDQPAAEPMRPAARQAAGFERFNLVPMLSAVNPEWDARLRQPVLEKEEDLNQAIALVQTFVKTALDAFPAETKVEGILITDAGLVEGKLDGRAVFVFVDTVSGGALKLYAPDQDFPLQSPSKGRAIVADGCSGFALDPTHGHTPRTVLLFRLATAPKADQ